MNPNLPPQECEGEGVDQLGSATAPQLEQGPTPQLQVPSSFPATPITPWSGSTVDFDNSSSWFDFQPSQPSIAAPERARPYPFLVQNPTQIHTESSYDVQPTSRPDFPSYNRATTSTYESVYPSPSVGVSSPSYQSTPTQPAQTSFLRNIHGYYQPANTQGYLNSARPSSEISQLLPHTSFGYDSFSQYHGAAPSRTSYHNYATGITQRQNFATRESQPQNFAPEVVINQNYAARGTHYHHGAAGPSSNQNYAATSPSLQSYATRSTPISEQMALPLRPRTRAILPANAPATVSVQSGGLSARRASRRSLAYDETPEPNTPLSQASPTIPTTPMTAIADPFVAHDARDPAKRVKKGPSDQEKATQEQMVELGGACIRCSEKRKICTLDTRCRPCQAAGIRCVRAKEEFWLLRLPINQSNLKGSYRNAVEVAKQDTIRAIFGVIQNLRGASIEVDNSQKLILHISIDPRALDFDSSLSLDIQYSDLFSTASYTHQKRVTTLLLQGLRELISLPTTEPQLFPHIDGKVSFREPQLVHAVDSAISTFSLIKSLQKAIVYSSVSEQQVAITIGAFVAGALAQSLGALSDEICESIRERLRHKKGHYAETRFALGTYYRIATELMTLNTGCLLDNILNALRSQLPEVLLILKSLFDKTRETILAEKKRMESALRTKPRSEFPKRQATINAQFDGMLAVDQDLDQFVRDHVPAIPQSDALHFAFYFANQVGLPVTSREIRQFENNDPISFLDLLPAGFTKPSTTVQQTDGSVGLSFPTPDAPQSLTEQNVSNLPQVSTNLSTSTFGEALHASYRTSQQVTAVSYYDESELTMDPSTYDFSGLFNDYPDLLTEEEKSFQLSTLPTTMDKATEHENVLKRTRSSESESVPTSNGPKRVQMEEDLRGELLSIEDLDALMMFDSFGEPPAY